MYVTLFACICADTFKPNAGMRYVSVDMQSDYAHNRQALATLRFTFGDYVWLHAGGGKTKAMSVTTLAEKVENVVSPPRKPLKYGVKN